MAFQRTNQNLTALLLATLLMMSCSGFRGSDGPDAAPTTVQPHSTTPLPESRVGEVVFRIPSLDRSKDSFPILFTESDCTSGSRADDRFRVEVVEDQSTIDVAVFVAAPEGDQDCQGNPWTPATIKLGQSIGDRQITGVKQQSDDLQFPIEVIANSHRQMPPDITFIEADSTLLPHSEAQCEFIGLSIGDDIRTSVPELGRESVEAKALAVIGGPYESMFRLQRPHGSTISVQFYEGTPVAVVYIYPTELGWYIQASRCAGLPEGWVPDSSPYEVEETVVRPGSRSPATQEDVQHVRSLLAQLDGLTLIEERLTFVDPEHRCDTMVKIEDTLHENGWAVNGSRLHLDEASPAGLNQQLARQTESTILRPDGQALAITTTHDDTLEVIAVPGASDNRSPDSDINPCFLDEKIAVNIQPARG